jgi:hypothetical protein
MNKHPISFHIIWYERFPTFVKKIRKLFVPGSSKNLSGYPYAFRLWEERKLPAGRKNLGNVSFSQGAIFVVKKPHPERKIHYPSLRGLADIHS